MADRLVSVPMTPSLCFIVLGKPHEAHPD